MRGGRGYIGDRLGIRSGSVEAGEDRFVRRGEKVAEGTKRRGAVWTRVLGVFLKGRTIGDERNMIALLG